MSMFIEEWSNDRDIYGDGVETAAKFNLVGWPWNVDFSESAEFKMSAMVVTGGGAGLVGTFTASVSDNRFLLSGHGLVNGDKVRFALGQPTNALPVPLVEGTYYYVVGSRINDFQVSTVEGGAVFVITTAGVGTSNEVWHAIGDEETLTQIECEQDGTFITIRFPEPIPGGEFKTVRLRAKVFV